MANNGHRRVVGNKIVRSQSAVASCDRFSRQRNKYIAVALLAVALYNFVAVKMNWSRKKVALLIELYRIHPELWNPRHSDYRDKMRRNRSWREISEIVQVEKMEVFKKIKNLCSQFHRERKKIERNRKMNKGGDGDHLYESRWFAFKSLSFLKYKNKPLHEQLESADNDVQVDIAALISNDQEKSSKDNSADDDSEDEESIVTKVAQPSTAPKVPQKILKAPELKRKQNSNPTCTNSSTNKTVKICQDKSVRDEFCIFGEMVACKIRNLPTKYARSTVQHLINNILYDAELGNYDHPSGKSTKTSRNNLRVNRNYSNIPNEDPFMEEDNVLEEENVYSPGSTGSNSGMDSDCMALVKEEMN